MKKGFSVFVVLMSFAMTGCVIENNSTEIAELKKEIEILREEKPREETKEKDVFFERNLTCLEHKENIKKELKDWSSEPSVEAIFYSPKEEECLVLLNIEIWGDSYAQKSLYPLSQLTRDAHPIEGCMEEGYFSCNKFAEEILEEYRK